MHKLTSTFAYFIGGLILIAGTTCNFAAGSYPYAEKYELDVKESVLLESIKQFKKDNPQYEPPIQTGLKDGRGNASDYWYSVYFYYPKENQLIFTWTRPADDVSKTTFAFVSINDGLLIGNWKQINKDFSRDENKQHKAKFEERILNKIK